MENDTQIVIDMPPELALTLRMIEEIVRLMKVHGLKRIRTADVEIEFDENVNSTYEVPSPVDVNENIKKRIEDIRKQKMQRAGVTHRSG